MFSSDTARDRVLDTALRLFAERGYFATSVHDIGRQAKVSIGSIYHHFGDKEGIAQALVSQLSEHMESLIRAGSAGHGSAHDRARGVIARLFQFAEQEPCAMDFMLAARHREFLPSAPPVCASKPFQMMREIVAEGMETGEIERMDVMIAASCLFGGPLRLIATRLDGLLERPLPETLDEIWPLAWRSIAR